jgi:outer membrane protein assembly factor BamE (lipoprotein component of BamABCDE complex)
MTKIVAIALTVMVMVGLIFSGCVTSTLVRAVHNDIKQDEISRNNENLMNLKIGMTQEQVQQYMGKPDRSDAYAWGSAWVYRTAMKGELYGKADSDFTPVVFDEKGILIGWGRDFLTEHVNAKR